MRIVADANILIASIFWNGSPYHIVQQALDKKFEMMVSQQILDEVRRVLKEPKYRFELSDQEIDDIVKGIQLFTTMVEPVVVKVVERDPNDDHIIGCAIAANADAVVTRDHDLLSLKEYAGIRIVAPEVFLEGF